MSEASYFFSFSSGLLQQFWVFYEFHINFRSICSGPVKNVASNLIRITLNLQTTFSSMVILTILIFPIQEQGISFYFSESSLISSINVLQFSAYKSFTSLVMLIPKYFMLFYAFYVILKGIVLRESFTTHKRKLLLYHSVFAKKSSSKIVIISAFQFPSIWRELESTGISYLLVRMSNDEVVGIGCDGQSSHREVVSRYCAVKLGTNQRHRKL